MPTHDCSSKKRVFGHQLAIALGSFVFVIGLFGAASQAQLPSSDDLIRAQQQLQQRQQQSEGNFAPDQNTQQYSTLQPAVPQQQVALPPSRLERILSLRAGVILRQFGYEQLGHAQQVIVPQTGAVQDDYILGPGDEIVVSIRGQENEELRTTVNRNGQVILPRLPPLAASGRNFGSFRDDLEMAIHRAYVATDASVAIGRVRQISVLVSGEVNQPGQRLLTGLSSAVDALLLSGGVRKTGSLRNIKIIRGGHQYVIDLYDILANSGSSSSLRLADGDQILVPPLGSTVAVAGLVRRPGIFELAPHTKTISIGTLLALAGGKEVRGSYRLSLLHVQADGTNQLTGLASETGEVRDGDILFVQLGADKSTNIANLSGGTGLAGTYPIVSGSRLSDILKAPGALGPSPYTLFGILVRKDRVTRMPTLLPFTPVAVLNGQEDIYLQSGDDIRVLSTNEARMLTYIVHIYLTNLAAQQKAVRDPLGQTPGSGNSLINQLDTNLGQNADEIENVASVPANVQRTQITALLELPVPGSELARERDEELRLSQLQRQPQTSPPQTSLFPSVQTNAAGSPQTGAISADRELASGSQYNNSQYNNPQYNNPQYNNPQYNNPQYNNPQYNNPQYNNPQYNNPQYNNELDSSLLGNGSAFTMPQNFTEQVAREGSIASNLEVQTFGQLARQLDVDPLVLINFLFEHRVRLDGAVRGPGYYFVGPNASLSDVVQAAGGTINWADESGVELISVGVDGSTGTATARLTSLPLRKGTLATYVVRPGDIFRFHQVYTDVGVGSVTMQGEVRYPGTYPLTRGEHLSDILARAGGLTNVAYPYGTVYLRQSVARLEREGFVRAADEVQNQLIVAMTRVGTGKIDPSTFTSMQTFVTELRNQQALGRISIVADPSVLAANPSLDPLVEGGDVIYVPPRPSTISVLGQVLQPGAYPFRPGETVRDYIDHAGGYSSIADEGQTFIVMPDGSARKLDNSWLSFQADKLSPGSAIVVPRDVTPLDLRQTIIDMSQIFSQLAVSIASVAVLSKQ